MPLPVHQPFPSCCPPWPSRCTPRFHQLRDRKLAQAAAACEKLINDATVRLAALARQEGTTMERMEASGRGGCGCWLHAGENGQGGACSLH